MAPAAPSACGIPARRLSSAISKAQIMAEQTQAKKYAKPLPHLDEENRPWWEALQRDELYIQKCGKCGDVRYYPRALCTNCLSPDTQWIKCSGRGKIYTFTTTYQNQSPGFRESLP